LNLTRQQNNEELLRISTVSTRKLGTWKIICTFLLLAKGTETWQYKGKGAAVELRVSVGKSTKMEEDA